VVNFDVERTRERDLERHFEQYGRLRRVQIKRNYAFVQVWKHGPQVYLTLVSHCINLSRRCAYNGNDYAPLFRFFLPLLQYETVDQAEDALKGCHLSKLGGRVISVEYVAKARAARVQICRFWLVMLVNYWHLPALHSTLCRLMVVRTAAAVVAAVERLLADAARRQDTVSFVNH
jgi:hypothetical protein